MLDGGDCVLASECSLDRVSQAASSSNILTPEGWALRLKIAEEEYYPGLGKATTITLVFSLGISIMVACLLTRIVWLYNRQGGKLKVSLGCGVRMPCVLRGSNHKPDTARAVACTAPIPRKP